jgi:DNA processing protein
MVGERTVTVISTETTKHYPAENRQLQDRIAAEGLVFSRFWPDGPPTKRPFPCATPSCPVTVGRASWSRSASTAALGSKRGRPLLTTRPVILTGLVVKANKWSVNLISVPGVHVASSTAEIMSIGEDIAAGPAEIEKLLAMAAGG